jgi:3-deoxy-7-phosphoheptulonate synthase
VPQTHNVHVREIRPLIPPRALLAELPISDRAAELVVRSRDEVNAILDGKDARLLAVVGPCSIHDERAALEYAERLAALAERVRDRMLVIMRVYFEKPRTTVGWKGLINDPHLNDTFDIETGLRMARRILLRIAEMGLPAGTEMLEPITPQYLADLISWASIGARTTESPTHRQMASGLSMPVGYKNGTDGSLTVAIDAMQAARAPHAFVGIDADGNTGVVTTTGNPFGHLILRGGRSGPNYAADYLAEAAQELTKRGLPPRLVVDCSHANSNKDYRQQSLAWNAVLAQRLAGNANIVGLMLESNLNAGKQKLGDDPAALAYGVSITDGCVDWAETESLIGRAYEQLTDH